MEFQHDLAAFFLKNIFPGIPLGKRDADASLLLLLLLHASADLFNEWFFHLISERRDHGQSVSVMVRIDDKYNEGVLLNKF